MLGNRVTTLTKKVDQQDGMAFQFFKIFVTG